MRRLFSFPVLLGILLAACTAVGTRLNTPDPDAWAHITTGEKILNTHTWPATDEYSFTAEQGEVPDSEWLGAIVIALAARAGTRRLLPLSPAQRQDPGAAGKGDSQGPAGSLRGMAALLFALDAAFIILLYYLAYLRCSNPKAAFLASGLIFPIAFIEFDLRPQFLGYSLFLVTLICLEYFRRGREKAVWILPPLFAVWVNTDGTFIAGLLVLGWYLASGLVSFRSGGLLAERWTARQRRCLLTTLLLSLLALFVTPYGSAIAGYRLGAMFRAHIGINEIGGFGPLSGHGLLLRVFLALFLPFLLAQVVFRPVYRLEEVGLFVVGVYAACVHTRFLFIFIAAVVPMLASVLARWLPRYKPLEDRFALNAVLALAAVTGLCLAFPSERQLEDVMSARFPRQAVAYLRNHAVSPAMLNDCEWGGYLIWASPGRKVFVDGRTALYEDNGVLADYLSMVRAEPKTLSLLRKYDLQACLIRRGAPLETVLAATPGWQRAYSDDVSTIMVRTLTP